jgi:hypothetical protein
MLPPQPGATDLGLESVKSVFRYCVSCSQFVGRGCCWNPDAVACTTCVPSTAPGATPLLATKRARRGRDARVRLALSELTASAGGLADVAHTIGPGNPRNQEDARSAWDAAWWATGWLVIRAESSRDAASKLLWTRSAKDPHPELSEEFRRELAAYEAELHAADAGLIAAGRRIVVSEGAGEMPRAGSRAWRRALLPVVAAAALVVAVVGIGSGAIDRLVPGGDGRPAAGDAGPTASERGAVLGGDPVTTPAPAATAAPAAPSTPAATPTAPATPVGTPDAVLASVEFDGMRMGALEEGSGITGLAGQPEIVSFPSPFDRSVLMAGDGSSGFCLASGIAPGAPVDLSVDLYPETTPTGSLDVVLADVGGQALLSVPLALLADQPLERWYRASISWPGAGEAELELRDVADGRLVGSAPLEASAAPSRDPGSICVSVVGTTPEGEILLDNITAEG